MQKIHAVAAAAVIACAFPAPTRAQSTNDLKQIREQIQRMKDEYEARIQALEKRLSDAEAKANKAEHQATQATQEASKATQQAGQAQQQAGQAAVTASAASRQERQNAFNPAISLILQGRYANFSQDPSTYRIGGFLPPPENTLGPKGFSLTETELAISASVDPYFSGYFTAALDPDGGASVENGYLQTSAFGHGFTLKAGRYFSGVGYLNQQHQHAWDFIDAPLPYRAFLGTQLADDGAQIKWVAPTELLVELGGEAGRGLNFPGSDSNLNGAQLFTAFGHVGGDVGESNSWRGGLSYLLASPQGRSYDDQDANGAPVQNAFSGQSKLWIADFVWKWAPEGNATNRNFKFQTEYFWRNEDGTLAFDQNAVAGRPLSGPYSSRQSGWYAQAVYQFLPQWRVGARYDRLNSGTTDIGLVSNGTLSAANFASLAPYTPWIATAMIDWSPSEFSRVRLQYERDNSRPNLTDNQFYLQYILSLGAHGAHIW